MEPEPLIDKILTRSVTHDRFPDRQAFFDGSAGKLGKNNFINRLKTIARAGPF